MNTKYKAVDLFCGAGGFSAGLISAGIEVVGAFDNWPAAVDVYCRNIGDHAICLDLLDIENAADKVGSHKPDFIVGGPPCQDFSTAGKRIEGDQANLTIAFANIIARCKPPFLLMENVPQARLSASYNKMRSILNENYEFYEVVLDASQCGVPQLRKRFFSFGWLDSAVDKSKFADWIGFSMTGQRLTVKEYLAEEIDIEYYYRHARNYSRRAIFSVHEPSPTIRGINRPVPPNYKRNHLDSANPDSVRPLTSWERSRIQTFPAKWDWGAKKSDRNVDIEQLIGNAVPVKLAEFVGKGVLNAATT